MIGTWAAGTGYSATTVTNPAPGIVRVDFLPTQPNPVAFGPFAIVLDANVGGVTIDGLSSFVPGSIENQFLGISAGSLGATWTGPTAFSAGGPNPGLPGMAMIYQLGFAGTLAPGVNTLVFLPNGAGGYGWSAF